MKRDRRRVRWGVVCAAAGMLAAAPALGGREGVAPARPPLVVEVRYGDSLWTIAREHGDPNRDVRDVVWRIARANRVEAGALQPGEEIAIPAECLP